MSKRAIFLCVSLGFPVLAAPVPWQKPAAPPAEAQAARVASAANSKEAAPAKDAPAAKEAAPPTPAGFPNAGESLSYSLKWPGGASLGEAHLRASKGANGWQFDFSLDASVPGFAVSDHYQARANAGFCSLELEKETTHGQRHTHEKTLFDYKEGRATRTTLVKGGGHTDIDINDCAHDGLDYIFFARRELGLGHGIPQQEDVLFGATYSVRMEFAGVQEVTVAGKRRQADHIILYLKGPASDSNLEIFFERDPARTPLIIKAPLPVGMLSMELVR